MPVSRHNPRVPETSLTSASFNPRGCPSSEEFRTAVGVILAAAANLRDYRDRLSAEDHTAAVLDIETAAEQISNGLDAAQTPPRNARTDGKRRAR